MILSKQVAVTSLNLGSRTILYKLPQELGVDERVSTQSLLHVIGVELKLFFLSMYRLKSYIIF